MEKRKTSNLERKRKIFHFFMILYVDKSHTHRKTKEKKDSAKSCLTHATPWTVACQLLCPWDSSGKNTAVGCHFLLQGIFLTQESNSVLQHTYRHTQTDTHKLELNLDVQEAQENHTKVKCVSNTRNNMKTKLRKFHSQ